MNKSFFCSKHLSLLLLVYLLFTYYRVSSQNQHKIFTDGPNIGLKSLQGEILIEPLYSQLGWSSGHSTPINNTIGYHTGKGWGLISLKNQIITDDKYYTLEKHEDNIITASVKDRFSNKLVYGTINTKGETIVSFNYSGIKPVQGALIISKKRNGKIYQGLFTFSHKEIAPINATNINHFSGDIFTYTDSLNFQGLINKEGYFIISPSLDSIAPCIKGKASIFKDGRVGLIDSTGTIIHNPTYKTTEGQQVKHFERFEIRNAQNQLIQKLSGDSVDILDNKYLVAYRNLYTEVLDETHTSIYGAYDICNLNLFKGHLIVHQGNRKIILKKNGELLAQHPLDSIKLDHHHIYTLWNNKWDIYDLNSNLISNRSYEQVITHSTGLIPVKNNSYWGYINHHGKASITLKYDSVSRFDGPLAQIEHVGFKSLIDQSGQIIGAVSYDSISINDTHAVVQSGSRTDIINSYGQILFQTYNKLIPHGDFYLEETTAGLKGLVTQSGVTVFEPKMDSISDLLDNQYFVLRKGNQRSVIKKNGTVIIPLDSMYQEILNISNGYIGVMLNHKYGFVNESNQLVIANRYDSTQSYHEGLCPILVNNRWGYINQKENIVVQPNFTKVSPFENSTAIVAKHSMYGVINSNGLVIIPLKFNSIERTKRGNFITLLDEKYALFDVKGNKVLGSSYDFIGETEEETLIVRRREKYGLINSSGVYKIPLKYDRIIEIALGKYLCSYNEH